MPITLPTHSFKTRRLAASTALLLAATPAVALPAENDGRVPDYSLANAILGDANARPGFNDAKGHEALEIYGSMQIRYTLADRDAPAGEDDLVTGFELARTRLGVRGSVASGVKYELLGGFREETGEFELLDAWAGLKMNADSTLVVGQFKLPFMREELIASTNLLAADRSVMHSVFTVGHSQGVMATVHKDRYRLFAAFSDGERTATHEQELVADADYALTGRFEYRFYGDWDQAESMGSFRGANRAAFLGLAAHYQDGGETAGSTDRSVVSLTGDVTFVWSGVSVMLAGVYRGEDPATGPSTDDFGILAQASSFIDDHNQLFARYDVVLPDSSRTDDETVQAITLGWSHYFIRSSHAAKLTIDGQYTLGDQSMSIVPADTTASIVESEGDQFALRAQMQIAF